MNMMSPQVRGARSASYGQRSDPRQADVDEANRLLAIACRAGVTKLPSLTAVDLCVLGGYRHVLFDEHVLQAWGSLTAEAREELGADALAALAQRGLLRPQPARSYGHSDDDRSEVHPALGMILGARAKPAWVAICTIATTAYTGPRMYGLGDPLDPKAVAVVEMPRDQTPENLRKPPRRGRLTDVYDYVLASLPKASDLLAEWTMLPIPVSATAGTRPPRCVDVYQHRRDEPLSRYRVAVECSGLRARVTVGEAQTPDVYSYDRPALADHLQRLIRRTP